MRKTWFVATVLAVLAAACGGGDGDVTPSASSPRNFETRQSGKLIVGSDIPYKPFEYKEGTKLTGFDVELLEAVAARLGLTVEWKDVAFDTIFPALAQGKFDVVASAVTAYAPDGSPAKKTVTDREKIVAFTIPYYSSLQSLTVNPERSPDVASIDDLKAGDKVGVQSGTTGQSWAKQNVESKGAVLVKYTDAPPIFESVRTGRTKAAVVDLPVALEAIAGKTDLKVVQQIHTGEEYGFAINKETDGCLCKGLKKSIDDALLALFRDGTYKTIFEKYFPDQELPAYVEA